MVETQKATKKVAETKSGLDDTEMVIESSEKLEVVKSFDDLGIREELLRGMFIFFALTFE